MKNQFIKKSWILALALFAAAGCSDNDPATPEEPINPEANLDGQFLVAGVQGDATYFLSVSAETLEDPNTALTIVNNGLEYNNTFTFWIPNGYEGLVALKYAQGNAHVGQRFTINSSGSPATIGAQFELQNGLITAGLVGDYVYSLMSGNRATYDQTLATVNRIPMSSGTPEFAYFPVNEFSGYEGLNAALLGVADAGNGSSLYTSLHFWGDATYNDAVVARINVDTWETEAIYTDSRLGYSGGQMNSARYSQIGSADNGDVYVFAGNYNGQKRAGALVIRSGASSFDTNYYWDIETASGGYRFRKVYHVTGNKYLLEFYNDQYEQGVAITNGSNTTGYLGHFAILDMETQTFTWITGLPDKETINVGNSGLSQPYFFNDKLYIGVSGTSGARFYTVDHNTGVASPGASMTGVSTITGITFVESN